MHINDGESQLSLFPKFALLQKQLTITYSSMFGILIRFMA